MRIGFIGLGHMGSAMAANLIKAGHQLTVFNRTRSKAEVLAAKGAKIADAVAAACGGEAVFAMLSNDDAVQQVVFAEGGVLSSLPKGAIHISSSTISVELSDRLEKAHQGAGQCYVAATVLGRPDAAAAGKLSIIAAGAPNSLARVAPLLNAIGQNTSRFGDRASVANLVKLATNFLTASVIESLGEALALTSKANVDTRQFLDFQTNGNFNAPVFRTFGEMIIAASPARAGFSAPLAFKDIRLALQAGDNLQVPMPFADVLQDRLLELIAAGGIELDWSALGRMPLRKFRGPIVRNETTAIAA